MSRYTEAIQKFNPHHDAKGRFSSADGAVSFTYAPGKSKAHDNAIARLKAKHEEEKNKGPLSGVEALSKIRDKKWEDELTEDQRNTLSRYQVDAMSFNEYLRTGKAFNDFGEAQATKEEYKAIDDALSKSKLKENIVVHRGLSAEALDIEKLSIGDLITDKGYQSTSLSKKTAEEYSGGNIVTINAKKGSKGAYISGLRNGKEDNFEVLLPRNSKLKIKNVQITGTDPWGKKIGTVEVEYVG